MSKPLQLDVADQKISQWIGAIQFMQESHFTDTGRYAQLTDLLAAKPKNGTLDPISEEAATRTLHDFNESWRSLSAKYKRPLPKTSYVQAAVDVYSGSSGSGYVCRFSLEIEGAIWIKRVAFGPLQDLGHDWVEETIS